MGDIVGVVLGAGASTRLGRPKQTLPFGDATLLGHVVGDVVASSLDRVVVVVGGAATDTVASLPPGRAEVVRNDRYGDGCASSLLAGLDAAGSCDAIMLLLGDMPGVDAAIVDRVLGAWRREPGWAAVTVYDDGIGHPFVFSATSFGTLRGLHGDKAVWKVVDDDPTGRVDRIAVPAPRPMDVDTWDDYLVVCERFGVAPTVAATTKRGVEE